MPMPMPMPGPMGMGGGGGGGGGGGKARGGGGAGAGAGMGGDARSRAVAATRKKTAAGQEMRHEMLERMRYIMHEIDETNDHFISGRSAPFQFLDVCCCPGGFSTYSLTAGAAPRKGIGLSLPPELGGHLPAIQTETDTYLLHFVDVTTVAAGVRVGDMAVGVPGCPRHALRLDAPLDAPPVGSCQLVILDGSFLGGKDWIHKETTLPDSENPAFNVYGSLAAAHKALLIAQLIVMANNLAPGGVLVLRLNMYADVFTMGLLGLLRLVFDGDVASYKPRSCHVHRASYYLVCTGFDPMKANGLQWVPRWYTSLTSLRAGGAAPRYVPFPGLFLDNEAGQAAMWGRALCLYHAHLWRFAKLVEVAMEEKAMLDQRMPGRPRTGRYSHVCGRIFAGRSCNNIARCNAAHSFEELHPFVQKAFREPRGFMYHPRSAALLNTPLPPSDPMPETLLELKQQAHFQAIRQAEAAAARQQAALAAAAVAASGNVLGHVGSYADAVEMGMGGEWVYGMTGGGAAAAAAASAAPPLPPPGDDGIPLHLLRRELDDNAVLEGGFDEDEDEGPAAAPPPPLPLHAGAPPPPRAAAVASPAASASAAASSAVDGYGGGSAAATTTAVAAATAAEAEAEVGLELEFEATAETAGGGGGGGGAGGGGGGGTPIKPELLRMSAYQPRLGLVTIEIEDDETLVAMLDYLGR
ncbi:hypothetical protein PLESTF_001169600 [Pleodorina starrii]|nr:hypothetical protein PLESTF_001169600 [Pleodorina starrii]